MATNFPASLDTFTDPAATDNLATVSHSGQHTNINDAMAQVQAKIGVNGSAVTTSLDYLVKHPPVMPGLLRSATSVATLDYSCITTSSINLNTQALSLTFFTSPISFTTTQVRYVVTAAAASSASGTSIGLYSIDASDNGTLIASVSSTTLFTSTTLAAVNWAASASIVAGGRYAVGFLNVVSSGTPTIAGANPGNNATMASEIALAPRWSGQKTGQSAQGNFTVGQLSSFISTLYAVIL